MEENKKEKLRILARDKRRVKRNLGHEKFKIIHDPDLSWGKESILPYSEVIKLTRKKWFTLGTILESLEDNKIIKIGESGCLQMLSSL